MDLKFLLFSGFCFSAALLPAQIAPGVYDGQTFDSLAISDTAAGEDGSWTFNGCTFENAASLSLRPGESKTYHLKFYETDIPLNLLKFENNAPNSTAIFEMEGSAAKRSTLGGISGDWRFGFYLPTAAASNVSQELRMNGYSDISTTTFNLASDTMCSGSASFIISGADNTFTATKQGYIGSTTPTAGADYRALFQISGVAGAKSTATFNNFLYVRAMDSIVSELRMSGNAEVEVKGAFWVGSENKISSGVSTFRMENSGNALIVGGNQLSVGENAKGGTANFIIGGSGNTLDVRSQYVYFGTNSGGANVNFEVRGSGHSITFANNLNFRAGGEGASTTLLFEADADGVSTISAGGVGGFSDTALKIDLSGFVGDESGSYSVALISAGNDWSALAAQFVGDSSASAADVAMGANGVSWEIAYAQGDLVFNYTYNPVPEPAFFGVACGFSVMLCAVWRRRRMSV